MKISFKDIDIISHLVEETELYKHYHYPEMLSRYDSNFIEFKRMPSLKEFIEAEEFLRGYHVEYGQNHLKFVFPQDHDFTEDLRNYFNKEAYQVSVNELYAIKPNDFPEVKSNSEVMVKLVDSASFQDYLQLQYNQDVPFGVDFAEAKVGMLKWQFEDENIAQFIAYYQGKPAGAVDVILKEDTAEIDNLFVVDSFQRKGIGSIMQRYIMESYQDKMIILIADGDDTPKEMYQKQKYTYLGYQKEVLKILGEEK
jgi:GNAT superfamily N-acetyltransferase